MIPLAFLNRLSKTSMFYTVEIAGGLSIRPDCSTVCLTAFSTEHELATLGVGCGLLRIIKVVFCSRMMRFPISGFRLAVRTEDEQPWPECWTT